MTPKSILFVFGVAKILQIIHENPGSFFEYTNLGNIILLENRPFEYVGQVVCQKFLKNPSNEFLKTLNMESISSKKYEMGTW